MWTAEWWWEMQERLPEGATIAPLIVFSDKTVLTQFIGDKQAWPVYLTIGNISKDIQNKPSKHAVVLLGYLPVTKLECLSEKARQGVTYRLFHTCISKMFKPLIKAGKNGVLMTCADGCIRRVFPILAAYVADYPEQCLIACVKENSCPICQVPPDQHGEAIQYPIRDIDTTLAALKSVNKEAVSPEYKTLGLRPVPQPFWENLPHVNIFSCFTPDLLHQLHKGVFKDHLVKWCMELAGKQEVDQHFQKMPSHPSLRHFKKGISSISQWTGREHKEMQKVFASLICGAAHSKVTTVARAVIDFIYYASFPSQSSETLWRI
ncbi:hypothetical protein M422DRAFT_164529 [Sphaerobolus stellatus SS14]|uniref:Uncharacterized protein n=1 Tax=Sphaerobolus stellatus (strain SS14) TaxID=990650 RepID=A0A0C9UVD4_SPHS4|nr:hypothetical protein M422DRAFT_164529 [Sphaerobolus stellatus SS14]